jgi:2',3'-cyclic-nucleotide 2'-phosphodiesterase
MKLLFIGDIVSNPGVTIVKKYLPLLKKQLGLDLVVANAENAEGGRGVSFNTLDDLKQAGCDFFTSGDHVFWHKNSEEILDRYPIIRPANYPTDTPGFGYKIIDTGDDRRVLIINIMGRTFLNERLDDPFRKVDEILNITSSQKVDLKIVDFHAEATSEKLAMGFYLDGRVDIVVGTHTHIPTCDQRVLPHGTYYLSDLGMCGNIDSVLGVKKEIILNLFLTARNQKFIWEEEGQKAFRSLFIDTITREIKRIDYED